MKPVVAFFEFALCDACHPHLLRLKEEIAGLVDIIDFSGSIARNTSVCDIAFIEGSASHPLDNERLTSIKSRAKVLVACGSCTAITEIKAFVKIDHIVHGCPLTRSEFIKVVKALVFGTTPDIPAYPVCMECKMAGALCLFDKGQPCLGPVSRAGCNAICPVNNVTCVGCRGLAPHANMAVMNDVLSKLDLKFDDIKRQSALFPPPEFTPSRPSPC